MRRIGGEVDAGSLRLADRMEGLLPGGDAAQPPLRCGEPDAVVAVDVHRRHVAAQLLEGVEPRDADRRFVGLILEADHPGPGDGDPRTAAAVVPDEERAVVLRIDAVEQRDHILEALRIAGQAVDVEVVGREPEVAVRILAHGDEAMVGQGREIAGRGAEILERIAVEAAHAVPRADPHEAPRIGVDVRDAVVGHAVERGIGSEEALRRRRRKEGRKQRGEGQQQGQQRSFHGRRFTGPDGQHPLREVSGSNGRQEKVTTPPFRHFFGRCLPYLVNIRKFFVQCSKAATIRSARRSVIRRAQGTRRPAAPGPSEAHSA